MRRLIAIAALVAVIAPVTWMRGEPPPRNNSQTIALAPVPFSVEDADADTAGWLRFIAGWELTSPNSYFGGFSAMAMLGDNRVLLLSDAGAIASFTLDAANHRATGVSIAPLPDGPPKPNEHAQQNWDAESLAFDPATGRWWVGFEQQHGVWRYAPSFARAEAHRAIAAAKHWPDNSGAEAMLRWPDGRFAVFSEGGDARDGTTEAVLYDGDPAEAGSKVTTFRYRAPQGYAVTDATLLPDGRALMLHRRFRPLEGVKAILSIGDPKSIAEGKTWEPKPIATLAPPLTVDNMEALTVTVEGDRTIVWIASDDNYNPVQRTLLLKFALVEPEAKKAKAQKKTGPKGPGFDSLN